jgi:hypothetical protein
VKLEAGRLRVAASDVANFLGCGHLTRLDLLSARGQLRPPHEYDAGFHDLMARGEAHERAVLAGFLARDGASPRSPLSRTATPRRRRSRPSALGSMSYIKGCCSRSKETGLRSSGDPTS